MKKEIINRLFHEKDESNKFFLDLRENNYKPMINSVLCQKFIEKKVIQKQNDEEYNVEDLPDITKYIRKSFESMISDILKHTFMSYLKSMQLLDVKISQEFTQELTQELYKMISECSTVLLEKYEGKSFVNSERQSIIENYEKNEPEF